MAKNTVSALYPVSLTVDYPKKDLNRLTTAFRIILIIPILIILALISGTGAGKTWPIFAGGILFVPTVLMILFKWKYPKWWFDWNSNLTKFFLRVLSYFWLLTDGYPSTEEEQVVHADIPYPNVQKDLKAGLPLVKWFLAIPHYICLLGLTIAAEVVVIISWFAILFTGKYPQGLFNFVVGVVRSGLRVDGYAFLLVTDIYPPFSLE